MVLLLPHLRLRGRTTKTVFQRRVANLKGALDGADLSSADLQHTVAKLVKFLDRTSKFTKLLDATDVTDEQITRLALDELPQVLDELQRALLLQQDPAIVEKLQQAQTELLALFLEFHQRASSSEDEGLRACAGNFLLLPIVYQAHNQVRLAAVEDKFTKSISTAIKLAAEIAATAYAIFTDTETDKLKLQQHLHRQLAAIPGYQQAGVKLQMDKFLKLYEVVDQCELALRVGEKAQGKALAELKQKYDDFFAALPEVEKEFFVYQLEKILIAKQPRFMQIAPASEATTEALFARLRQFADKSPVKTLQDLAQRFIEDFSKIRAEYYPYAQRYRKFDVADEESFLQALQNQLKLQIPAEPALRAEFLRVVYPKVQLLYPALLKHEWLAASDPINLLAELAKDSQRHVGHKARQDKDFTLAGELVAAFVALSQAKSAAQLTAARERLGKLISNAQWVGTGLTEQLKQQQLANFAEYVHFHVLDQLGTDKRAAPLLAILKKQLVLQSPTGREKTKTPMGDIDDASDRLQGPVNEVLAKLADRVLDLQQEDKFTKNIQALLKRNDRGIFNSQLKAVKLSPKMLKRQVAQCGAYLPKIATLLQQASDAYAQEKDPGIKAAKLRNLARLQTKYDDLHKSYKVASERIARAEQKKKPATTAPAIVSAPGVSAEKITELSATIAALVTELTAKLDTVQLTLEAVESLRQEYKEKIKALDFNGVSPENFKSLFSKLPTIVGNSYTGYESIGQDTAKRLLEEMISRCVTPKLKELKAVASVPATVVTTPVSPSQPLAAPLTVEVVAPPQSSAVAPLSAPVPTLTSPWGAMVQDFAKQADATVAFNKMVLAAEARVPEVKVPAITATNSDPVTLLRQCERQYDVLAEMHRAILHTPGVEFAAKVADKRLISQLIAVNNALDKLVAAVQFIAESTQPEAKRASKLVHDIRQLQHDQLWHYFFSHADQVLEGDQQLPSAALVAELEKISPLLTDEWGTSSLIRAADGHKPALGYEDYSSYARDAARLFEKITVAKQQGYAREMVVGMPQGLEQLYAEAVSTDPKKQPVVESEIRAWRLAQPLADAIVALVDTDDLSQIPAMLAGYHELASKIALPKQEPSIFYPAFVQRIKLEIQRSGHQASTIITEALGHEQDLISKITQQITAHVKERQWLAMLDWESKAVLARTVQDLLNHNEEDLIQQVEKQWQLQQAQQELAGLTQELAVIKAIVANEAIEFAQREQDLATLSATVNTALAAMPKELLAQGRDAIHQQLLLVRRELSEQTEAVALKDVDCAQVLAPIMQMLEHCPPLANGLASWWLEQLGAATPVIKERLPSIAQGTDPAPCGQQLLAIAQHFQHWQLGRVAMLQLVRLYDDFIEDATHAPEEISVARAQAIIVQMKKLLEVAPEAEQLVKNYYVLDRQAIAEDESVSVVLARRMEEVNVAKLKDTCLAALHGIKSATSVADIEKLSIHTLLHELSSLSPIAWSVLQLAMTNELELDSGLSATEFAREFSSFLAVYSAEKQQLQLQTVSVATEYVLDPLRSPELNQRVAGVISRYEACYRDNQIENVERMARGLVFQAYSIVDVSQRQAFVKQVENELSRIYPNFKVTAVAGLTAVECVSRAMVEHVYAVQPQLASSENLKLSSSKDVNVSLLQIKKTAEQAYAERIDNLDKCIKSEIFYSEDFTVKVDKLVSLLDMQSGVAYKKSDSNHAQKIYLPLVSKALQDLPIRLAQLRRHSDTKQFVPNSKLKAKLEANYQQLFAVLVRYQAYAAAHASEELQQLANSEHVLSILASANVTANQQRLAVKLQPLSAESHSAQAVVVALRAKLVGEMEQSKALRTAVSQLGLETSMEVMQSALQQWRQFYALVDQCSQLLAQAESPSMVEFVTKYQQFLVTLTDQQQVYYLTLLEQTLVHNFPDLLCLKHDNANQDVGNELLARIERFATHRPRVKNLLVTTAASPVVVNVNEQQVQAAVQDVLDARELLRPKASALIVLLSESSGIVELRQAWSAFNATLTVPEGRAAEFYQVAAATLALPLAAMQSSLPSTKDEFERAVAENHQQVAAAMAKLLIQRVEDIQQEFSRLCTGSLVAEDFWYEEILLDAATLVELQAMAEQLAQLKALLMSIVPSCSMETIDNLVQNLQVNIEQITPEVKQKIAQRQQEAGKDPNIPAADYVVQVLINSVQENIAQLQTSNLKRLEFSNIDERLKLVINLLYAYKGLVPAFYQALPSLVQSLPEGMPAIVMPTQASPNACEKYLSQLLVAIKSAKILQLAQEKLTHLDRDMSSFAARAEQRSAQLRLHERELSPEGWIDAFKQAQKDEDNYDALLQIIGYLPEPEQQQARALLVEGLGTVRKQIPMLAQQAVKAMLIAETAQLSSWAAVLPRLWHFGKDPELVRAVNETFKGREGCKPLTETSTVEELQANLQALRAQPKRAQAADKQAAIATFKQALYVKVKQLVEADEQLESLDIDAMLTSTLVAHKLVGSEEFIIALRTNILKELCIDLSDEAPIYDAELFKQSIIASKDEILAVTSISSDEDEFDDLEEAVVIDESVENIINVLLAVQPLSREDQLLLSTLDSRMVVRVLGDYNDRLNKLKEYQVESYPYQALLVEMQNVGNALAEKSPGNYQVWSVLATRLQGIIKTDIEILQRSEQVNKHVEKIIEQYQESDPRQLDLAVKNIRDFYLGDGSANHRANAYLQQGIAQELADRLEEEGHSFEIDRSDLAAVLQEAEEFFLAQRLQPVLAELEQYGVDMHAMQSGIAKQLQALLDSLPASRRESAKLEFLQKYIPSLRLTPEQVAQLDNLQFAEVVEQQLKLINADQEAAIAALTRLTTRLNNIADAVADDFSVPEGTSLEEQLQRVGLLRQYKQRYEQQQLALSAWVKEMKQLKAVQPQLASVAGDTYQLLFDKAYAIQQQLSEKLPAVIQQIAVLEDEGATRQHAEKIFTSYQAAISDGSYGLDAAATITPNYIVEHRDAWRAQPELQQAIAQAVAQRLEQSGHTVVVDRDDLDVMLREVEKFCIAQAVAQRQEASALVASVITEIEAAAADVTALEAIDIARRLVTLPALLRVSAEGQAVFVSWANGRGFTLQSTADADGLTSQVERQLRDFVHKVAQPRHEQIVAGVKAFVERHMQLVTERVDATEGLDDPDTTYPERYENFIRGQFEDYQGKEREVFVASLLAELGVTGEAGMDIELLLEQVREKFAEQITETYVARVEVIAEIKGLPGRLWQLTDAIDGSSIEALQQQRQELAAITAELEQAQQQYPHALPSSVTYDELLVQAQALAVALTERMDALHAPVVARLAAINARQAQVVKVLYGEQHYNIAAMANLLERREALEVLQQPIASELSLIDRLMRKVSVEIDNANALGIDSSSLKRQLELAQQTRDKLVTLQQDNSKQLNMLSNSKLKTAFAYTEPLLLVNGLMRDIEQGSIEQLRDLLSGEIEARLTPLPKLLNVSRRVCKGFVVDINSKYPVLKLPAMRGLFMNKPIQQYREAITKYARIRAVELLCEREQQIRQQAAELCAKYHGVAVDSDQLWTEFEEIHLQLDARERELFIETIRETLALPAATTTHAVGSAVELQALQQQLADYVDTPTTFASSPPATSALTLESGKWAVFYTGGERGAAVDAKINFIATSINQELTNYAKYPGAEIAMHTKRLSDGRYLAQAAIKITDPSMQAQDKMRIMIETMESVICTKPQMVVIDGTNPYMVEVGRQMAEWVKSHVETQTDEYDNYTFKIECDVSQCTIDDEVKRTVTAYMEGVKKKIVDQEDLKNPQHFLNLLRAKCIPPAVVATPDELQNSVVSTAASLSPSAIRGGGINM